MIPWYLGNSFDLSFPRMIIPLAAWSIVWTGLVLWYAARRGEKSWFIFFLLVHTAGIVELLYLIFVAKVFVSAKARRK